MTLRETCLPPAAVGDRAAPAGGPFGGRGCAIVLAALLGAPLAADTTEALALPSGQQALYHDFIRDTLDSGLTVRFRFLAPWITEVEDFDAVFEDMEYLCDGYARDRVSAIGPQPSRIVITLMSEPTEFAVANPEVVQFFESFSLSDGVCIWEVF